MYARQKDLWLSDTWGGYPHCGHRRYFNQGLSHHCKLLVAGREAPLAKVYQTYPPAIDTLVTGMGTPLTDFFREWGFWTLPLAGQDNAWNDWNGVSDLTLLGPGIFGT